ncbi:MAG: hypothetical protein EOM54_11405 [Clostridia bacterium]|nr:hypothetical protein [Clostridia bacterium]
MPRIYADVESHSMDWGAVAFTNGAAAVPYGSDTAYWTDKGYALDANKDVLTIWDTLTRGQLEEICDYYGISYTDETAKQAMVRAIESAVSTAKLTALTVTSSAGTAVGDSNIDVTGEIGTSGNKLYYKLGTAVLTPYYKDQINAGWTEFEDNDDITPGATDTKITVVETNAAGEILALGSATLTVKT